MPPYLRVVEPSAWMNGLKIASCCSGGTPMPVSDTLNRSIASPVRLGLDLDGQHHFAALRELDRHSRSRFVTIWRSRPGSPTSAVGTSGWMSQASSSPFTCARLASSLSAVARQSLKSNGMMSTVELAGLDLREVEDVVDDGQQRLAGRLDHVQVFALLGGEVRVEGELGHADDAVQRGANLVAHVGQELALRAVGGVRRILRAFPLHDLRLEGTGEGDFCEISQLRRASAR